MTFEYSLNIEEFRELAAVINGTPRKERPILQLLTWLFCFCGAIFNTYLVGVSASLAARNPSVPDDRLARQNLWNCLSPQLCVATFLLIGVIWNPARSGTMKSGARSQRRRAAGLISWLSLAWLIPTLWPLFEIDWAPTVGQLMWGYFKSYAETDRLLLLFNIDGQPCPIPKRAVLDDQAMDELKMLISENIAEGKFAMRQRAFPVIPKPSDGSV